MAGKYSLNDYIRHHSVKLKTSRSARNRSYSEGYLAGVGIKSYSFKKELDDKDYASGFDQARKHIDSLYEAKCFGKVGKKK